MRITFLRSSGITWDEIESHRPPMGTMAVRETRFAVMALGKVGETRADANVDALIDLIEPLARWGAERESNPSALPPPVMSSSIRDGLARIERGPDGMPRVILRTREGEYEGWICGCEGMDPPELIEWTGPNGGRLEKVVGMSPEELRNLQVGWHAAMLARQRVTRETALVVRPQAVALMGLAAGGRDDQARIGTLKRRLKSSTRRVLVKGNVTDLVTVDVIVPKSSKAARLRVRADAKLFPIGTKDELLFPPDALADPVPKEDVKPAIGRAILAAVGSARGLQTFLAGMAVIEHEGGLEIGEDGKVPKAFRLAVMDLMGMPTRTANGRQRKDVEHVLSFLLDAELVVSTYRKGKRGKPKYVPFLVRQEFHDHPDEATGRGKPNFVVLNDRLLPGAGGEKSWRIPKALIRIEDRADGDGVKRLMGFRIGFRTGMGTGRRRNGNHENLETFLKLAGLWDWVRENIKSHGEPWVMRTLRAKLDELRALPMAGFAAQDVAGGTEIEGERIEGAVIRYRNPAAWTHSSPGDVVADMSRHARQAPNRRGGGHAQVLHEDASEADSGR